MTNLSVPNGKQSFGSFGGKVAHTFEWGEYICAGEEVLHIAGMSSSYFTSGPRLGFIKANWSYGRFFAQKNGCQC